MEAHSGRLVPGPDLIADAHILKTYGARMGLHIETVQETNVLRWVSTEDGVYGTLAWEESRSDWHVRACLQEQRPHTLPPLFRDHRDSPTEASQLLLLLSLMEAGQQDPQRQGWLLQDLESAEHRAARTAFTNSVPASKPERGFVLMLRTWISIFRTQHDCEPLTKLIPQLQVMEAGGAIPFQAFGNWEDHPFYFRYRHASASLAVGGDDPVMAPLWSAQAYYGAPFSGFLDISEFMYLFAFLGSRLATAPQPYPVRIEFPGSSEPPDERPVYGHSQEDALKRAREWARTTHPNREPHITFLDPPVAREDIPAPPTVPDYSILRPENLESEPADESPGMW